MSFGRDKLDMEREARFEREKENYSHLEYARTSGSPLRRSPKRSPRSRSFGKNVQFGQ